MPVGFHEFLQAIQDFKERRGFVTTDDDYRKRLWLPHLPDNRRELDLMRRRGGWEPGGGGTEEARPACPPGIFEKSTRIVDKGVVMGVGAPVPRYVDRGPATAKEFQGARSRLMDCEVGAGHPPNIPLPTAHYLMYRNSEKHSSRDCVDVDRDSATLWRDLLNARLDNRVVSGVLRWYHPLVASAAARFRARWPEEAKKRHPDAFFAEFRELFGTPSRLFVLDWIDEQLTFPGVDHSKVYKLQLNKKD